MKKQLLMLSLSLLALSACVQSDPNLCKNTDPTKGYSILESGYVSLLNPEGKDVADLDDKFQNLSAVNLYKDKIIAMGDLDFGQMTTIIDSKDGKVIDAFMHFYLTNPWDENRPALQSPSGRYILFRKFHSAFSEEEKTSNFVMVYDLDLSPAKNRECNFSEEEDEVYCGKIYAGKFFYPKNEDFHCSTCSTYKTLVYDEEDYAYIIGNKWDTPKTVLQVNYPKVGVNDFLIVEETNNGLTQKLLKFNQAKLYDIDGNLLEYTTELEDKFYMVGFCLKGNTLKISNLKDSSKVASIVFEL